VALPEIAQGDPVAVSQERLPDGELLRAGPEQEPAAAGSILASPEPNWWMAISGSQAWPQPMSGVIGKTPETGISGTAMLPM